MRDFFKHAGLIVGGAACVAGGVLFPPAAGILGTVGAKLLLAGGGVTALAVARPVQDLVAHLRR